MRKTGLKLTCKDARGMVAGVATQSPPRLATLQIHRQCGLHCCPCALHAFICSSNTAAHHPPDYHAFKHALLASYCCCQAIRLLHAYRELLSCGLHLSNTPVGLPKAALIRVACGANDRSHSPSRQECG